MTNYNTIFNGSATKTYVYIWAVSHTYYVNTTLEENKKIFLIFHTGAKYLQKHCALKHEGHDCDHV